MIADRTDFLSGALFAAIGGAFAWSARSYDMGTANQMGAGYFPFWVGMLLVGVGAVVMLLALRQGAASADNGGLLSLRPLLFVLLANSLFGILLGGVQAIGLPPMGLLVAIVVLVVVSAGAGTEFRLTEALVLAVVLAAVSYLIFVKFLGMRAPILPEFGGQGGKTPWIS